MSHSDRKKYFKSPHDRDGRHIGAADMHGGDPSAFSRRQFLEAAGFTMSLAVGGCRRAPVETALPFVVQPAGVVPGRMQSYASTCAGCSAGCGLLVGVRDGRPLKIEGMPEHPVSHGGLCAIGQALPLGLYDSHRLSQPLADGRESDWDAIDTQVASRLSRFGADGAVVVITSTVTSPTLRATIEAFLEPFADGRHITLDAVSSSAILDAHQRDLGTRVLPRFRFDRAKVIVSLGADFLGTWISPVEFTMGWRSRRVPLPDHPEMSYHVQMEGRLSLTGSNADRRYQVAPDEYASVLSCLAAGISHLADQPPPEGELMATSPIPDAASSDLVERLWNARGKSLIVCDSQDVSVQQLVNYINFTLDNYGTTLDVENPSRQRQGNDADVANLVDDLKAGKVSVLVVAGTDLTHNLPDRATLTKAIKNVPLVISFAERMDDFASLAHFVCPDHHPLESWMDAEPVSGVVSLTQPTLQPLLNTRSILESLHRWTGARDTASEIIKTSWREKVFPRTQARHPFQAFWDQAVHDGVVEIETDTTQIGDFQVDQVTSPRTSSSPQGLALLLYSKVGMTDSRHAHNPWLQELPDPVTKVTWDNYVCLSQTVADEFGLANGDMVRVQSQNGASIELPAFIQPGQHKRVLAIALGYGVRGTDRFTNIGPAWLEARPTVAPGELVGKNAADFTELRDGCLQLTQSNVTLERIPGRRELASTQQHHSLDVPRNVAPHGAEVRNVIQETTLTAFTKSPQAGTPEIHHYGDTQLWAEDHPKTGHHWGMVIDLNCCTGCSACLIACQSENNVPVVGKDEVRREREMHWIRVDRYYSGAGDDLNVAYQPMMCHHCDNAPCETVCPVLATVHGSEGLNEQVYNRCVGTRYCANNCPYKVRRFNWFKYKHDDQLQNLALNPDVTVRRRGVMEKCTMCVQRIEDGKLEARRRGQPLVDGTIQTACQQSCPAKAIIFGDMNDPDSRILGALESPRRYAVLEEFNFRPSISYLRLVKNKDVHDAEPVQVEDSHHA